MRFFPLAFALLFFTACQTDESTTVDDRDMMADDTQMTDTSTWQTSLDAQDGFDGISGNASADVRDGQTQAMASVSGAPAGGAHPWHIHFGTCGSGGGIVGAAGAYPMLEIGDDGSASANATIDVALDSNQSYYVNVHASADDLETIVACGDLSRN